MYILSKTYIFSKKKFFFNLVLQQMNNHMRYIKSIKTGREKYSYIAQFG